ncbi:MAG: ABC transporter ATP-binding protein [Ardenticatenales bacterium]|nr:ABC transporter ATP-binding protein [Ardenticatenales bacterium]
MVSRETLPLLRVQGVSKQYGAEHALRSISLEVHEGEIVALLGPSGSGKSTLLRCVAGLEMPGEGDIFLREERITERPPYARGFGMMFQQFALFPHRTVAENIAFGLKMQRVATKDQLRRVEEMLALIGLPGYGQRSIFELSGGEQQRVALARSIAPRPPLLMLDEPLGSLDRTLRERLMDELRSILKSIGMTALYVTHDQQEAFAISDRLLLMNRGEKIQEGSPEQLYRHPVSRFAAEFFGLHNYLPVQTLAPATPPYQWEARTSLGSLCFTTDAPATTLLLVRPEAARLAREEDSNVITGTLHERSFRGSHYRLVTAHEGSLFLEWEVTTPQRDLPNQGDVIQLALRPDAITFLTP